MSNKTFLHFAPDHGWMNDPNGLVYKDGWYHMYFQWNPTGLEWGNIHWGHARRKDLMHWEQLGTAIKPTDDNKMPFSGSAFIDERNVTGLGENTVLFFYTLAGDGMCQKLAYTHDFSDPLNLYSKTIVNQMTKENRDPKVFWHEKSNAYIMVLYYDEADFLILRSDNLLEWTVSQRLTFEKMWECPDLFELTIKDENATKWVFWSADGYYHIGEFDGYTFVDESGRLEAYNEKLSYAAQTFTGVEGRVLAVAWKRMPEAYNGHRGVMSVPTEYTLVRHKNGDLRLEMWPCREFFELATEEIPLDKDDERPYYLISEDGRSLHIVDVELEEHFGIACENYAKRFAIIE